MSVCLSKTQPIIALPYYLSGPAAGVRILDPDPGRQALFSWTAAGSYERTSLLGVGSQSGPTGVCCCSGFVPVRRRPVHVDPSACNNSDFFRRLRRRLLPVGPQWGLLESDPAQPAIRQALNERMTVHSRYRCMPVESSFLSVFTVCVHHNFDGSSEPRSAAMCF